MILQIGDVTKLVELFVVQNNLSYILLGLHCQEFKLIIDCSKYRILQNDTILIFLSKISKRNICRTLHLNTENYLQNVEEKNECEDIPAGNNDSYSELVDIMYNYEHLYEWNSNPILEEENLMSKKLIKLNFMPFCQNISIHLQNLNTM